MHVHEKERVERLKQWFETHKATFPQIAWYQVSACTGSTLGIFCLVSYTFRPDFDSSFSAVIQMAIFFIFKAYIFCWII
nr:DUF2600 family protein [Jeotgalibacillus soli]